MSFPGLSNETFRFKSPFRHLNVQKESHARLSIYPLTSTLPPTPLFSWLCVCLINFLKPNLEYRIIILVKQVHMVVVESVNFILII